MENANDYDFLSMGANYARETFFTIRKKAREIEKNFGQDARLEFEAGVAYVMPHYDTMKSEEIDIIVNGAKDNDAFNAISDSYYDKIYSDNEPKARK